jgi:hypothetical protein
MEPGDYNEIPLCKILHFVSHGTTHEIKPMGIHNRIENGHGAQVALCAHPTHTDTDT